MSRALRSHELSLLALVLLLAGAIALRNPAFLGAGNLFALARSCVTLGLFALGALVVLVSGGIDVSFPAIAAFCLYVTSSLVARFPLADHIAVVLLLSASLGGLLGLLNAFLIHRFALSALIVTLGTASLIRGGLLAFIGTRIITDLPDSMVAFSRASLLRLERTGGGTVALSASVLLLAAAALGVHLLLARTLAGRGVYALGGDPEAARRVGFRVGRLQAMIYALAGALAGLAGVIHASSMRNANPFDLEGTELTVIAAVVLGGASITGGRGSVAGTLLGVLLLVMVESSMILLGLPSEGHQVAVGAIIVASTALTAWRRRRERARARGATTLHSLVER